MPQDKYASFSDLEAGEILNEDYRINLCERQAARALIIAPHGGSIEIGTSELATLIAGEEHSLFTFDGLKARGRNRELHITSHNFDHPDCVALAARHSVVLTVHGCKGEASQIYVGGLDVELSMLITDRLTAAGFPTVSHGHRYPGRNQLNICNRGARGRGAQLELTPDLRVPDKCALIASIVRGALADYST
ncbi:MAG TPA: poly-gamma-glutamate hydrolase family protein [Steroidobacteraceae bacterium]